METVNYLNVEELVATLRAQALEMERYFELQEPVLSQTYAVGKWSIREILHHLADAECVLSERIRRGIARPGQVVWGFDPDAWAEGLDYARRDLDVDAAVFAAVRRANVEMALAYYESAGANRYVHNETGLRTVKEEFDKVAWHNEHHLRHIRTALG